MVGQDEQPALVLGTVRDRPGHVPDSQPTGPCRAKLEPQPEMGLRIWDETGLWVGVELCSLDGAMGSHLYRVGEGF